MSIILEEEVENYIGSDEPPICHIGDINEDWSLCGLKPFTPETVHSKEECIAKHQQCVVCLSIFETRYNRVFGA
jgi:hypothetical protein